MKRPNLHIVIAAALALGATSASAAPPGGAKDPSSCASYPYGTAPLLPSVVFNESDVLQSFATNFASTGNSIRAWYTDEHALTLGVRQVIVKTLKGSTTFDYASSFSAFNSTTLNAVSSDSPLPVGTTALSRAQAGTDLATWNTKYGFLDHGRPMWPALFITDITTDAASTTGRLAAERH